MKRPAYPLGLLALLFHAQLIFAQDPGAPLYLSTNTGPHERLWSTVVTVTNDLGEVTTQTNAAYTEVATGLNYFQNGQWTDADEQIEILDAGGAVARHGQHQVWFPADIGQGDIVLVMPDGKRLRSRPAGLAYFDGTNNVLIAEPTNSIGVVTGNKVTYTNCFANLNASLRLTYTQIGLEQDVILHEKPLPPEAYGLSSAHCRLLALTEFISPPQPQVSTETNLTAGLATDNDELNWGSMRMAQGKAFSIGSESASVFTTHTWELLDGRQILVEQVPLRALAASLDALQLHHASLGAPKRLHLASNKLPLPARRQTQPGQPRRLTRLAKNLVFTGLVIDYVTVNGTMNNYTFAGDTTYYVSANVTLTGTSTFEDGCVLKYAANTSISLGSGAGLNWLGTPYRPIILTSRDDTSVGAAISGATGSVTTYYANPALSITAHAGLTLANFRITGAQQAISANNGYYTLLNGQIVDCSNGVSVVNAGASLRNLLFANVSTNLNQAGNATVDAENVTFGGSTNYPSRPAVLVSCDPVNDPCTVSFTNCIIANMTAFQVGTGATFSGVTNGFYNNTSSAFGSAQVTSTTQPFQQCGAGFYYLASGSGFQTKGTTALDATLLAELSRKTTVAPPTRYTNTTLTSTTTWSPAVARDNSPSTVDLGYHYCSLDYMASYTSISSSASLLLTNGVCVGLFGNYGFAPNGGTFVSQGFADNMNELPWYPSVQEEPILYNNQSVASSQLFRISAGANAYTRHITLRFTDLPNQGARLLFFDTASSLYDNPQVTLRDCRLRGLDFELTAYANNVCSTCASVTAINNDFERCTLSLFNGGDPGFHTTYQNPLPLIFYNNLFWSNTVGLSYLDANATYHPAWTVRDNLFDGGSLGLSTSGSWSSYVAGGYNAFHNLSNPFGGSGNVTLTSVAYAASFLGPRYVNSASPSLVDVGSRTAPTAGLYHYTTLTSQVPETNSQVDIGFHYVATDQNGKPLDADGDGDPDYLADLNGNGTCDSGENCWAYPPGINPISLGNSPLSQTVMDTDTATLCATVTGTPPLNYAWYFTPTGSTSSIQLQSAANYLRIDAMQPENVGTYTLVVGNAAGSLTLTATLVDFPLSFDGEVIVVGPRQNYEFFNYSTYLVTNEVDLYGPTVIHGGTIIKFSNGTVDVKDGLTCKTSAYDPAILTSLDDDNMGTFISEFSSGDPNPADGTAPYLTLENSASNYLSCLRFLYAPVGVLENSSANSLWDSVFLDCATAVELNGAPGVTTQWMRNDLFSICGTGVQNQSGNTAVVDGQNLTADQVTEWLASAGAGATHGSFTNCIFSDIAVITAGATPSGNYNAFYNVGGAFGLGYQFTQPPYAPTSHPDTSDPTITWWNMVNIQGSYYLATGCPLIGGGTNDIDPALLNDLAGRTTQLPIPLMRDFNSSASIGPMPIRNVGVPDVGWHYPAVDYVIAGVTVEDATLNIDPGTVLAETFYQAGPVFQYCLNSNCDQLGTIEIDPGTQDAYNGPTWRAYEDCPNYYYPWGIRVNPGGRLNVNGTPTSRVTFAHLEAVQEFAQSQFVPYGPTLTAVGFDLGVYGDASAPATPMASINVKYADFPVPCGFKVAGESPRSAMTFSFMDIDDTDYDDYTGLLENLVFDGCYFEGGQLIYIDKEAPPGRSVLLRNSVFEEALVYLEDEYIWPGDDNSEENVAVQNCLFHNGTVVSLPLEDNVWVYTDNIFDDIGWFDTSVYTPGILDEGTLSVNSHNAYSDMAGTRLHPPASTSTDPALFSVAYHAGPLGSFYLSACGTALIDKGSRSAAAAGLYHFTTSTNNTKEAASQVDIGPHYLALVGGQPSDVDGDGIPDFIEDRNGNGIVDTAVVSGLTVPIESDWQTPNSGNGSIVFPTDGSTGLSGTIQLVVSLPAGATNIQSIDVLIDDRTVVCSVGVDNPAQSSASIEVDTAALSDGAHTFALCSMPYANSSPTIYSSSFSTLTIENSINVPQWQRFARNLLNINAQTAYPNQSYAIWWWPSFYPRLSPPHLLDSFVVNCIGNGGQSLTTGSDGSIAFSDNPANYNISYAGSGPCIYSCIQVATDGSTWPYTASVIKEPITFIDPPYPTTGLWAASYTDDVVDYCRPSSSVESVMDNPIYPGAQQTWIHSGLLQNWISIGPDTGSGNTQTYLPGVGTAALYAQTWPLRALSPKPPTGMIATDMLHGLIPILHDPDVRNFFEDSHGSPKEFVEPAFAGLLGNPNHRYRFVFLKGCEKYSEALFTLFGVDAQFEMRAVQYPDSSGNPPLFAITDPFSYMSTGLYPSAFVGDISRIPFEYKIPTTTVNGLTCNSALLEDWGEWHSTFLVSWVLRGKTLWDAVQDANAQWPLDLALSSDPYAYDSGSYKGTTIVNYDPQSSLKIAGYIYLKYNQFNFATSTYNDP